MSVTTHFKKARPEKFGTVIGIAPGGVPSYSSDYDSADSSEYPSRRSYMGEFEGVYTGYRYQCVEFARRWLIQTQGITFGDVGMAYEVMRIGNFEVVETNDVIPLKRTTNGGKGHPPVLGSVILWKPQGFFRHTGHIGIITHCTWDTDAASAADGADTAGENGNAKKELKALPEIMTGRAGVAEQNVTDAMWPKGSHCAREMMVKHNTVTGEVTLTDIEYRDTAVLGWVTPKATVEAGGAQLKKNSKV